MQGMVDIKNMTTEDRVQACLNVLDKLPDMNGRAKCGYIYILGELLELIQKDVSAMNEELAVLRKNKTNQNGGEFSEASSDAMGESGQIDG